MKPTIKDVAKKADVSIATVSRILNDLPGYKAATKEKVMAAISELDYRPNAVARGLINRKTQTIGVMVPDVSSLVTSEVLKGIEQTAHSLGHSVIVSHTDSNGIKTMKYLQLLNEKRVDGILFTSEYLKDEYYEAMMQMNVPVVLISTESYKYPFPYVKVDDRHASYTAVSYLINKGHKHIGMISGTPNDLIAGVPRMEGYKQALADHGLSDYENIASSDGFSFKDGAAGMNHLLDHSSAITAVFAASDEMAVGAMSVAYERGFKIPDDISVMGYDNIKLAAMTTPALTTVSQPFYNIGATGANMLFELMKNGKPVGSSILPHEIIERKSVKTIK